MVLYIGRPTVIAKIEMSHVVGGTELVKMNFSYCKESPCNQTTIPHTASAGAELGSPTALWYMVVKRVCKILLYRRGF